MMLIMTFTWTIGIVIGKYGLLLMLGGSEYYTLKFTIIPSILCMPVLLLLSVAIPVLSQRYVNRESVVERLRRAE